MSVRVNERNEGDLQVLNCARNLLLYTINSCRSENVFPKSSRWIMANKIVDAAMDACTAIQKANTMRLETMSEERYRLQIAARASLSSLSFLVDIAYSAFSVSSHKIDVWTGFIEDTNAKLNAWMKSDRERLKSLKL